MRKYLEFFKDGFDSTINEKIKPENWPYLGYSASNEQVAYGGIPKKMEYLNLVLDTKTVNNGDIYIIDISDSYALQIIGLSTNLIKVVWLNIQDGIETIIQETPFEHVNNTSILQLSYVEFNDIVQNVSGDCLYARFYTNAPERIIVSEWSSTVKNLTDKSYLVQPGVTFTSPANKSNTVYRMRYSKIVGKNLTVTWGGNSVLYMYFAYENPTILTNTDQPVIYYQSLSRKTSKTINSTEINGWSTSLKDDFVILRCENRNKGTITFSVSDTE